MPAQDLSDLISGLAAQAVEVQKLFDAGCLEDSNRFALTVAAIDPESRYLVRPLAPARMLLREFEVACSLSVASGRETQFDLKAFPLNLNYSLRHSLKYETQSRMKISVEQVPLRPPANP